jgi:hypothetical protein
MNDTTPHPTIKKYQARVATNGFTAALYYLVSFANGLEAVFYRILKVDRTNRAFVFGRHRVAFDRVARVETEGYDARIVLNTGKVYRVIFETPDDDFLVQVKAWGLEVKDK